MGRHERRARSVILYNNAHYCGAMQRLAFLRLSTRTYVRIVALQPATNKEKRRGQQQQRTVFHMYCTYVIRISQAHDTHGV